MAVTCDYVPSVQFICACDAWHEHLVEIVQYVKLKKIQFFFPISRHCVNHEHRVSRFYFRGVCCSWYILWLRGCRIKSRIGPLGRVLAHRSVTSYRRSHVTPLALNGNDTVSEEIEEERDLVVNSAEDGNRFGTHKTPAGRPSWTLMWPFSKWYRSKDQTTSQPSLGTADPHQQSTPSQNNIDTNPPTTRTVKPQRAWVPSQSKLSLQVFWGGYRMWANPFFLFYPTW